MLNDPEVVASVNANAIPVKLVVTDGGVPSCLRVLAPFAAALDRMPWYRTNAALFGLLDADGERMFAANSEQIYQSIELGHREPFLSLLTRGFDRYRLWREDPEALEPQLTALVERALVFWREPRLGTSLWIRGWLTYPQNYWSKFVELLRAPLPGAVDWVAPGVRNAAIHALARVIVDDTPLEPLAARLLAGYCPDPPGPGPIPPKVRAEVVEALEVLTGRSWSSLPAARRWWLEHRDDQCYRIEFSRDPALRYALLRPDTEARMLQQIGLSTPCAARM